MGKIKSSFYFEGEKEMQVRMGRGFSHRSESLGTWQVTSELCPEGEIGEKAGTEFLFLRLTHPMSP